MSTNEFSNKIRGALFVLLAVFTMASTGWAATYYVSSTVGSDTNGGTTEGTAWQTIAKVNASSFNPDDNIYFKKGDTWRETLIIPSSGTSGHQITFGAYGSGDKPIINGSNLLISWTYDGAGNIWKATVATTEPTIVFFDGVRGTKKTSKAACTALKDWFWASNILYVYDGSATNSPIVVWSKVENAVRNYAIYDDWNGRSYITIDGLELANTIRRGIYFAAISMTSVHNIIQNCTIHHTGPIENPYSDGILIDTVSNVTISNNTIYECGTHGILLWESDSVTVEHNTIHDNYHSNVDIQQLGTGSSDGHIVRYNYIYRPSTSTDGQPFIYAEGHDGNAVSNLSIYYNLLIDLSSSIDNVQGVQLEGTVTPANIYNNTFYNCKNYCILLNNGDGTVNVKNNIAENTGGDDHRILRVIDATNKTLNYNCWNVNSGIFAYIGITGYSVWATYKSGTGFDANSINSDPLFANAGTDFHLQLTSPAINAGTNVGLTQDYTGVAVPQGSGYDIGSYEFVSGVSTPPSPPKNLRLLN